MNSRKRAMFWGRLRYRGLIEQPRTLHDIEKGDARGLHETRFCYFYSPQLNDFLMTGPRGYNAHT